MALVIMIAAVNHPVLTGRPRRRYQSSSRPECLVWLFLLFVFFLLRKMCSAGRPFYVWLQSFGVSPNNKQQEVERLIARDSSHKTEP